MSSPLVTARKLTDFVQSWCGISTVIFVKHFNVFLSKNCFVERRTSDIVNNNNFVTLRVMIVSHFRIFTCVCIVAKNAF
jgi:acetyltransferase-like isoleucine patch superfamily enzyme